MSPRARTGLQKAQRHLTMAGVHLAHARGLIYEDDAAMQSEESSNLSDTRASIEQGQKSIRVLLRRPAPVAK